MENVTQVASYIVKRYNSEFHQLIDEMKLHKLLYLTQRESLIQLGEPMFSDSFEGWRYGPVMVSIRALYAENRLNESLPATSEFRYKVVFDSVFSLYAVKSSWSLSDLTHCESSWLNSRKGLSRDEVGHVKLSLDDIRKDALEIKRRRAIMPVVRKLYEGFANGNH